MWSEIEPTTSGAMQTVVDAKRRVSLFSSSLQNLICYSQKVCRKLFNIMFQSKISLGFRSVQKKFHLNFSFRLFLDSTSRFFFVFLAFIFGDELKEFIEELLKTEQKRYKILD